MGQWISPGAATALANKLPYESSESRSACYRLPLLLSFLLHRSSLDISRIMKSRESSTAESLRLSFLPFFSPSQLPPPSRHLSRSYCLASAFGIMHNSMARGLHLDTAAIGYRSSVQWCRWFAILGRLGRGRLSSSWEHLAQDRAALPSRIYRTEYHVRIIRSMSARSSFTEGNRERDRFEYSAREKFDHDRPLVVLRDPSPSCHALAPPLPPRKLFSSADADDELSSRELGSGSRYAPLKVLSDDCAKKAPLHFRRDRTGILCLMCSWIIASTYINRAYINIFFKFIKISKQQNKLFFVNVFLHL